MKAIQLRDIKLENNSLEQINIFQKLKIFVISVQDLAIADFGLAKKVSENPSDSKKVKFYRFLVIKN